MVLYNTQVIKMITKMKSSKLHMDPELLGLVLDNCLKLEDLESELPGFDVSNERTGLAVM